jgi:hypothetical protein
VLLSLALSIVRLYPNPWFSFLGSPGIFFIIRTTSCFVGWYDRLLTTLSTLLQRPTTCQEAKLMCP